MRAMQDQSVSEDALPHVRAYILEYIQLESKKPISIESWCYGLLSRVEIFLGNKDKSANYLEKAITLNPNFSRAFAIPKVDPPLNALSYNYQSFFRPF